MEYSYFREVKPGHLEITQSEIPLSCPELKTQLIDYLSRVNGSVRNLTVDFSRVEETTFSCPAILLHILTKAREQGIKLSLEGMTQKMVNQLKISRLNEIFNNYQISA